MFLKDGDACSGYLFGRFKKRMARTRLDRLRTEEGTWLEDPEDIKREVHKNYSQLFYDRPSDTYEEEARIELLRNTNDRLTAQQTRLLEEMPTDCEIFDSLKLLSAGEEGGTQGCPLSPLLSVLATLPIIRKIQQEDVEGSIKPVRLNGSRVTSCICMADDLAVFTDFEKGSVRRLFEIFMLTEKASGGKINRQKSKLLLIGAGRRFPTWAEEIGIQLVGSRERTRYLGAQLTTMWRGVDNGEALLSTLQDKAKHYSSPLLSLETRVLVIKHGLFPVVIHQLMTTSFKKTVIRGLEKEGQGNWQDGLDQGIFLLARRHFSIRKTSEINKKVKGWRLKSGLITLEDVRLAVAREQGCPLELGVTEWRVLGELIGGLGAGGPSNLTADNWVTEKGERMNLDWRAAVIYDKFLNTARQEYFHRLNGKWRVSWEDDHWMRIWKVAGIKGLSQKHKIFFWRVLVMAFYDGTKVKKLGWPDFSCSYCGSETEDFMHAVWLCPR
ncbi:hypothetical protein R1sor_007408 [Riccia sorocarpa]|uniref:Reverse transcriptase domain-containing protein n=1 Tax=Riccia sorocarpa TaxID=122646 RepID=A0ABD3HTA9_9MARC